LQPRYEDEAGVADVETDSLVALARGGDREAFAEVIERHYDLIYRAALKWSGNRSDAEDVAQEVCIKLGVAIRGFDGRSAFTSWVYRITLNAVRDMVRGRVRQTRKADALALVSPDEAEPDQEAGLNARAIWDAVRGLPDKQRDAVLLVYAEEMSHAQAAQIMGIKEATVSWHVHEAKKALRGLL
jgi:RNA polymerase sigma-70 factor (ECF subfamily)